MSLADGQKANQTTFNNAFVSKTATTGNSVTGKIDLQNADVASGGNLSNIQRELNKLNSFLGSSPNTAYDAKPSWANNDIGASTDSTTQRADLLTERFNPSTGHSHDGAAGEGPRIDYQNIEHDNFNQASGGTITALDSGNAFIRITGASATEVQGILAPLFQKRILIHNLSSGTLTFKHQNAGASAANRIITTDGADLDIEQNSSVEFIYDLTQARWIVASGSGGGGSNVIFQQESIGTGDGVTTDFGPLTYVPSSESSILVLVDGLAVDDSEWSLSGADISFTTAPAAAQNIYVFYQTEGTATPAGPTGTQEVEYRTITVGEAAAKSLTLSATPLSAGKVMLDVIGGSAQEYSVDYIVSGTTLSWNGLGLDGVLASGDKLRIHYLS